MNKALLTWLLLFSIQARAQTWNGGVSPSWNTPANWTPAAVPTFTSNVILNSAATPFKPTLPGNIGIASLNMTAGKLDLAGFTLTCTGTATLDGDSLTGGKIVANNIGNFADNRVVGKLTLQKNSTTGTEYFYGNNKVYADSLIVVWGGGTLHFDYAGVPDTVFGTLAITTSGGGTIILGGTGLRVDGSLVLSNPGGSSYNLGGGLVKSVGGSVIWASGKAPTISLENVQSGGAGANGPFSCTDATIQSCSFAGAFSLTADSNQNVSVLSSVFLGAANALQAGVFGNFQNNVFNTAGTGTTTISAANKTTSAYNNYWGGNRFRNNFTFQGSTPAGSGGQVFRPGYYGADSVFGSATYKLVNNATLVAGNGGGVQYVGGNLTLDASGSGHDIAFTSGGTCRIGGNLLAIGFVPNTENLSLYNVTAAGTASNGTFRCGAGVINGCSFAGDFTLLADSAMNFDLQSSQFLGANNFFRAGEFYTFTNNIFGQSGTGLTTHIAASKLATGRSCYLGNNKIRNNWLLAGSAPAGGSMGLFPGYYGADSCFGAATIKLGNNTVINAATSGGTQYVADNLTLDADGTNHSTITFSASGAHVIGGGFIAQAFSGNTGTLSLNDITALGTTASGTFQCGSGSINGCSFGGDFTLIADSAQNFDVTSSQFLGANNYFRAGQFYTMTNNVFGQTGTGTTTHVAANNTTNGYNCYLGNNRIRANWLLHAAPRIGAGIVTLHPNYYSADSCFGTATWKFSNASNLHADIANDTAYTAGNLILDADGGSHNVVFNSSGAHFIGGALQALNFSANTSSFTVADIRAFGSAASGAFQCGSGSISTCLFSGPFTLLADSAQNFDVTGSQFLGANNMLRAGQMYTFTNNVFGQAASGTTSIIMAGKVAVGFNNYDGGNRYRGALTRVLSAPAGGAQGWFQSYYSPDSVGGPFTLQCSGASNANLANQTAAYFGDGITVANAGTGIVQSAIGNAMVIYGTDTMNFSYTGTEPVLRRMRMNKTGGLRLLSPLRIHTNLTLDTGVILTTSANMLTMLDGATATGLQRRSFVDGPMKKVGNSAFSFPVGDSIFCAPIGITAPASPTDEFVARYYRIPPHAAGYDTSQHDASIRRLSALEYWTLERAAGTSGVKVTLSHDSMRSGLVASQSALLVAHWKGVPPSWTNEGSGTTTGNIYAGTVQGANTITTFSPFTLGSTSAGTPLPSEGIVLEAARVGREARLAWRTPASRSVKTFAVERSSDGAAFDALAQVSPGQATPDQIFYYTDTQPRTGRNFYRIRAVRHDNSTVFSAMHNLVFEATGVVGVYPNPASSVLYVSLPAGAEEARVRVLSVDGRTVMEGAVRNGQAIDAARLTGGIYWLEIADEEGHVQRVKFMKQ